MVTCESHIRSLVGVFKMSSSQVIFRVLDFLYCTVGLVWQLLGRFLCFVLYCLVVFKDFFFVYLVFVFIFLLFVMM